MNKVGKSRIKSPTSHLGRPTGKHRLSHSHIKALLIAGGRNENDLFQEFAKRTATTGVSSEVRRNVRERIYCLGRNGHPKCATDETLQVTLESLGILLDRVVDKFEILDGPPEDPLQAIRSWISRSEIEKSQSFTQDILEQVLLCKAYAVNRSGPVAVREFLQSVEGNLLCNLAESRDSLWSAAARFVWGKLLTVDLVGKNSTSRTAELRVAMSAWKSIESPVSLPAPVLLPGIGTEAPLDSLTPLLGGHDPETRTVPVPFRLRATSGLALAHDAIRLRRRTELASSIAQVESDIHAGAMIEQLNPMLELNLRVCESILQAVKGLDGKSNRSQQGQTSDSILTMLDDAFGATNEQNAKYWEWHALAIIGKLLAARSKTDRNRLFDDVCLSIHKLLELRVGNAPFLAFDPSYAIAFDAMKANHLLREFIQRGGVEEPI